MIVRCPAGHLSTKLDHITGNEEAEMMYLVGPALDAELAYRRADLIKTGTRVGALSKRARRAAAAGQQPTAAPVRRADLTRAA